VHLDHASSAQGKTNNFRGIPFPLVLSLQLVAHLETGEPRPELRVGQMPNSICLP
jgi:hypothetical protein